MVPLVSIVPASGTEVAYSCAEAVGITNMPFKYEIRPGSDALVGLPVMLHVFTQDVPPKNPFPKGPRLVG